MTKLGVAGTKIVADDLPIPFFVTVVIYLCTCTLCVEKALPKTAPPPNLLAHRPPIFPPLPQFLGS